MSSVDAPGQAGGYTHWMLWEAASHGLADRPCQVSATNNTQQGGKGWAPVYTHMPEFPIDPEGGTQHCSTVAYAPLRGCQALMVVCQHKLYSYGPAELDCFRGANSMPAVNGFYSWFITVGFSWVRILWGSQSRHTHSTQKWTSKLLPKSYRCSCNYVSFLPTCCTLLSSFLIPTLFTGNFIITRIVFEIWQCTA